MKKSEIMRIIDANNTNKSIQWRVVQNTKNKIVLTNDYDTCINFSIEVKHDELDEWIVVRDNHMDERIALLIWDEDTQGDYKKTEEGIELAIGNAVCHFNSTY